MEQHSKSYYAIRTIVRTIFGTSLMLAVIIIPHLIVAKVVSPFGL